MVTRTRSSALVVVNSLVIVRAFMVATVAQPASADAKSQKAADKAAAQEKARGGGGADVVVVAKNDKPVRSPKNPNDGKDNDPDDGDAGKGNDDKTKKKDGPAAD